MTVSIPSGLDDGHYQPLYLHGGLDHDDHYQPYNVVVFMTVIARLPALVLDGLYDGHYRP